MTPPRDIYQDIRQFIFNQFKKADGENREYFTMSFGGPCFGQFYLQRVTNDTIVLKLKTFPTRMNLRIYERVRLIWDTIFDSSPPKVSP